MSLTLKLFSLVTRTAAKPIGNYIKKQAREHDRFRTVCIGFAQKIHRIDMRLRLGLLQDTAVIDRQIKREAADAEEKRLRAQQRLSVPTVKTEEQAKADDEAKKQEVKFIEGKVKNDEKNRGLRMIRPLSENKAIELGANFFSESFVFAVAVSLLLFETWRSRRKDAGRREDTKEKIDNLEDALKLEQQERGLLETQLGIIREELESLRRSSSPITSQGGSTKKALLKPIDLEHGHRDSASVEGDAGDTRKTNSTPEPRPSKNASDS